MIREGGVGREEPFPDITLAGAKRMNYLIIGDGVAGSTAAENIRKIDPLGTITVCTEEAVPFYYKIKLPEYICGQIDDRKILAKPSTWYQEQRIALLTGVRVVAADPGQQTVTLHDGRTLPYDRLLLAAGSKPFLPPIKGVEKEGVFTLTTMADAQRIREAAAGIESALVVGGGLLGLEAGNGLRQLGKKVTIIEFFPRLLPRQLDPAAAALLQEMLQSMGFAFRLAASVNEILGDGQVTGLRLADGQELAGGLVLISAGVRPNLDLAALLGLTANRGVLVDEFLATNQASIYAAGDVVEFNATCYGSWTAAMQQGKVAGLNMAGQPTAYRGTVIANMLKVVGIDLASAGNFDPEGKLSAKTLITERSYTKIVLDEGVVVGGILLGNTKKFGVLTKAIDGRLPFAAIANDFPELG